MVAPAPSPAERRRIAQALWGTVPPAAATEIGAVAVMLLGVLPGLVVALAVLVVLVLALPRIRPSEGLVRVVLLVAGPPLRYALVVAAVWYAWAVRTEGPLPFHPGRLGPGSRPARRRPGDGRPSLRPAGEGVTSRAGARKLRRDQWKRTIRLD